MAYIAESSAEFDELVSEYMGDHRRDFSRVYDELSVGYAARRRTLEKQGAVPGEEVNGELRAFPVPLPDGAIWSIFYEDDRRYWVLHVIRVKRSRRPSSREMKLPDTSWDIARDRLNRN